MCECLCLHVFDIPRRIGILAIRNYIIDNSKSLSIQREVPLEMVMLARSD